jgi:hypothetical protein
MMISKRIHRFLVANIPGLPPPAFSIRAHTALAGCTSSWERGRPTKVWKIDSTHQMKMASAFTWKKTNAIPWLAMGK